MLSEEGNFSYLDIKSCGRAPSSWVVVGKEPGGAVICDAEFLNSLLFEVSE